MRMKTQKPMGEYAVGTVTYTVRDVREEALKPGTLRSVPARVDYPAHPDAVKGREKSRRLSRNTAEGLKRAFHLPLNYDKLEETGETLSECYEDAPRIEGARFPPIVFNHGLCSYREGNSFLCTELASHGYAVISVAHPLDAACAEFDDGSCVFCDKSISKKAHAPFLNYALAMGGNTAYRPEPELRSGGVLTVQRFDPDL